MPATKKAAARRVPAATEPIDVHADVETWQNETPGVVAINRVGEYGRRVVDLVQGGRRFQVTPQERRMNQNAANSVEQDIFTNGTLRPIDLLDDDPDTERLRSNPNIFREGELPELFNVKGEVFRQRIAEITNPATLARLIELARDPRYDASLSQYEAIKSREMELRGTLDQAETKPAPAAPTPSEGTLPRGHTPR